MNFSLSSCRNRVSRWNFSSSTSPLFSLSVKKPVSFLNKFISNAIVNQLIALFYFFTNLIWYEYVFWFRLSLWKKSPERYCGNAKKCCHRFISTFLLSLRLSHPENWFHKMVQAQSRVLQIYTLRKSSSKNSSHLQRMWRRRE